VSLLGVIAALVAAAGPGAPAHVAQSAPVVPPRHVFTIVLENKDYRTAFGRKSKSRYLSSTLRKRGTLLPAYFGIAHDSLPNYLAMVAGVEPTKTTKADCPRFDCAYPATVPTLPDQLELKGLAWRGYMQDLPAPCPVPIDGNGDPMRKATRRSQYATRHDPFVYFHSITDRRDACLEHVVGLSHLKRDLKAVETTPAWSFISPDLCADGHDDPCRDPQQPGGMAGIDAFLRRWVPRIMDSAAFKQDGLLVITFDEAEDDDTNGGGRVGALLLGPGVKRGGEDRTAFDHYAYLRSMADLFGVPRLGAAAEPGTTFQAAGLLR
jgi:phosphatidylinositol-3-phosphatase